MALITPEYRELQQKLHATGKYALGVNSLSCAGMLAGIAEPGASVLDYGCGNGHLKPLLAGYDVREYDPCIDGKDGKPEPADYVVCSDVLEHIEPDLLDNVLGHINSLTRKRALLIISTRPAGKTLADGRNAHLIIEDLAWWKERLGRIFRIEMDEERNSEAVFICEPARSLPVLKPFGVMKSERNEFAGRNIGATWKRIPDAPVPAHDKLLIVCNYGPSIGDTWEKIETVRKQAGAEVVSVSGAHDFLLSKGIKPTFHIECDPRPHKSGMMKKPRKGVKYLMASSCHPDYIKRFEGYDLTLWHLFDGEESYKIRDFPSERTGAMIPGGGCVGLRALTLFYFLGYRNFIIHGFDCSYANGKTHAGKHTQKQPKVLDVIVGDPNGPRFTTAPVMVTYAQTMLKDIQQGRYPKCQFWFEGEGLFQAMLKAYIAAPKEQAPPGFGRDYFSMTDEDVAQERENAA